MSSPSSPSPAASSPFGLRFVASLVLLAAMSAALLWVGRTTSSPWIAVAAAVAYTVPLTSLWEWLVHGVLYHRRVPGLERIRLIHHAGHHCALFPPEHYVHPGPYEFMRIRPLKPFAMSDNAFDNLLTSGSQVGLHFVVGIPSIVVPAWWFSGNAWFWGGSVVSLALISWLLAYVHGAIHTPRQRFIERTGFFDWLDRRHYIHHIDMDSNMNFMLPLCDVLFGTQRLTLSAEEAAAHPSFEAAKPMAPSVRAKTQGHAAA